MPKSLLVPAVWITVLVFSSATLMAESSAPVLYADGDVTLNGKEVGRLTDLFTRHKVRPKESIPSIALSGPSGMLPTNERIVLESSEGRGTATISTHNALLARVSGATVILTLPDAKHDLANRGDSADIATREGDLSPRGSVKVIEGRSDNTAIFQRAATLLVSGVVAGYRATDQPGPTAAIVPTEKAGGTSAASKPKSKYDRQKDINRYLNFAIIALAVMATTVATGLTVSRNRGKSNKVRP